METISFYDILYTEYIIANKGFKLGETIDIKNGVNQLNFTDSKANIVILPNEFHYYYEWVSEYQDNNFDINYIDSLKQDPYEDNEYIGNKELVPIEELISKFIFLRIIKNDNQDNNFEIIAIYSETDVFDYWIKRNTFDKNIELKGIGITKTIFNLLPENHNYYDMSEICDCGQTGCFNSEVWYIKHVDSFTIPFKINDNRRMLFDIQGDCLENEKKYTPKDYIEEDYEERRGYNSFPFLFESKEFKVFSKTIFSNIKK
jgi:hypothetical protein